MRGADKSSSLKISEETSAKQFDETGAIADLVEESLRMSRTMGTRNSTRRALFGTLSFTDALFLARCLRTVKKRAGGI